MRFQSGERELDATRSRRKIETANLVDARLALIKELPTALGSLKVQELNLGDNMVARLADAARDVLGNPGRRD